MCLSPGQSKIHVAVEIEGVECEMEVDSGSTFSLISEATARQIFPNGRIPKLKQLDVVMKDYQGNCIAVQGMATVTVKFRGFAGPLKLVIVKGQRQILLGLDWFPALGIKVTRVHRMDELATAFDKLFEEFAVVFDGGLGCYKGPPVKLALNPEVVPVRLKARRVPFALRQKIDAELDKLLQQGVLEPVDCAGVGNPYCHTIEGKWRHPHLCRLQVYHSQGPPAACISGAGGELGTAPGRFHTAAARNPTHDYGAKSPAELLMGRKLSTMLDRLHPDRAPEKSTRLADSPSKPRTFQA
ncbi:hypothetical protein MRX96_047709 [Rhipicephalus microplus]